MLKKYVDLEKTLINRFHFSMVLNEAHDKVGLKFSLHGDTLIIDKRNTDKTKKSQRECFTYQLNSSNYDYLTKDRGWIKQNLRIKRWGLAHHKNKYHFTEKNSKRPNSNNIS